MSGVCTSTLCKGLLKIRRGMFWHTIKNGQIIYQMALENFSPVIMEGCPNVGISGEGLFSNLKHIDHGNSI